MSETPADRSGMWASLALALALCLVLGSSLIDLLRSNAALAKIDMEQAARVAVLHKAEAQLNSLARGVQKLAADGNPNAAEIVATLQRNGVRINPGAAPGLPAS